MEKKRTDFCTTCRKEAEYYLQKKEVRKVIRDKEYTFKITVAVCKECGEEMSIPGLIDQNVKEIDEQYRNYENIVKKEDIEKLLKLYKMGKGPTSLVLGFGEITIKRYMAGQVPSKEYSDIIRKALTSPSYMKEKIEENKEKIALAPYRKGLEASRQLENLFSISTKLQSVIDYLFESLREITPLGLQKLLYFTQGVSLSNQNKPMFNEICQAWIHGPVYPEVYNLFKDFKYNPIDDDRFVIFDGAKDLLNENEKRIIDLVINSFGLYNAKTLERITHKEDPWLIARKGYDEDIPSQEPITIENIREYYKQKNKEYDFSTAEGLNKYISATLLKGLDLIG